MVMKNCTNCENHPSTNGICCPVCAGVLNVMVVIKNNWTPDELPKLRDTLREGNVAESHQDAKNRGATILAKLLWFIIESGRAVKMHPNNFRSKVCDGINAEISGMDAIRKHEDKAGAGSYDRMVADVLHSWVAQIEIRKA